MILGSALQQVVQNGQRRFAVVRTSSTNSFVKTSNNKIPIYMKIVKEASYPHIEELLFMKFLSKFFRNGTLKTGSVRVLKSFRSQEDTNHHEYTSNAIPTPPRSPSSVQARNFGFWCNNSMRIRLVSTYVDAIEYCKNLQSFVCK